MKLTKFQVKELRNCHEGVGNINIHVGNGDVRSIDLRLGRDGNFYTGNMLLDDYLKILKIEITEILKSE